MIEDAAAAKAPPPDLVIVDIRGDASSAMAGHRAAARGGAGAGIFAVALERRSRPDPAGDARRRQRVLHLAAGRGDVPRRDPPDGGAPRDHAGRPARGDDARVLRRQGRRRHDDDGGELRRRAGAAEQAADGHRRPEAGPRRGRAVPRRAAALQLLDAIDNLHRLDREFLRELVVKHKSGLEILAGSDHFDRPGAADGGAIEELFRLLARQYEYIVVDAGSQINSCTVAALYAADTMFLVANPDVPSVRNAQRLLERVRAARRRAASACACC